MSASFTEVTTYGSLGRYIALSRSEIGFFVLSSRLALTHRLSIAIAFSSFLAIFTKKLL